MNFIQVILNKYLPKNINFKKYSMILIVLITVGAFMSFYGVPKLVQTIVKYLCVLKPGHFTRQKQENKLPFTYKLYLWNVTNPDEIAAGTEKPKLDEIGPYVFSQFKQKIETNDSDTEDTFSFDLWNIYHFNTELSAPLTGDEIVILPNVVLVAATTKIKLERPYYINLLRESMDIIFKNPSSIFVTMKAIEFIDKGFEVDCKQTAFAAKLACAEMRRTKTLKIMNEEKTFLRYRWFDKLNNSIQARYSLLRGVKNIHDVGRITDVNGRQTLKLYKEDEKCNVINGTDKLFFPPFQEKSDVIWAYSHDACKSFVLRYKYMTSVRGAKTAWKSMDIGDPLMSPACECDIYSQCTPHGTLNMYPCLDIFVLGSLPHFYLTDPSMLNTLDGMEPKEHAHKAGIYFDLLTGAPILTFERYQVSWLVKRVPEYPIFSSIAGDIYIPVFWYEESFSIEKSDLSLIIFSRISTIVGVVTGYILMVVGLMGLGLVALRFHYHTLVIPEVTCVQREGETTQANGGTGLAANIGE